MVEDQQIVELYWARNERAIEETDRKYGKYCFSIACNILSDSEDARECVNDAYLNAWNSMPPHRPQILSTFLGKVTRFACLKKWRNSRTQKRGMGTADLAYEELSECLASGQSVDEAMQAQELAVHINGFLNTLKPLEQRAFICRYWYFDSVSTISKQLGCSESKIKSMLHRLRKKLRLKLIQEGIIIERG